MEDGAAGNQSGWNESAVTVWSPQAAPFFSQGLPVCSVAPLPLPTPTLSLYLALWFTQPSAASVPGVAAAAAPAAPQGPSGGPAGPVAAVPPLLRLPLTIPIWTSAGSHGRRAAVLLAPLQPLLLLLLPLLVLLLLLLLVPPLSLLLPLGALQEPLVGLADAQPESQRENGDVRMGRRERAELSISRCSV